MLTSINLYVDNASITSCLPNSNNNMYTLCISNFNWPTANISLGACYANWTPEMETTLVSCALPTTPTPTSQKILTTT